jgi:hypothetical protein
MGKDKMPLSIQQRCFDLKCKSKRGEYIRPEDSEFLKDCFEKYSKEYSAMGKEVFEATKPFGAC